ncbi:MAG: hypothetical protein AAF939_03225 [Planctomycetota bacterium]
MTEKHQESLFPTNHQSADTSLAAFEQVKPKLSSRKLEILNRLLFAGTEGLTRYELAFRMRIPVQSITGPVKSLVDSGDIFETGDKRPTPMGATSKVLQHRNYGGNHGK